MPAKRGLDLVGKRFGRLIPVMRNPENPHEWVCGCDCGARVNAVRTAELTSGRRKSCGCISKHLPVATNPAINFIFGRVAKGEQKVTPAIIELAFEGVPKGKQKAIRLVLNPPALLSDGPLSGS